MHAYAHTMNSEYTLRTPIFDSPLLGETFAEVVSWRSSCNLEG